MALPALADCKPGLAMSEYNVLVAAEDAEEKTKGGIILPDAVKETNAMASMRGLLVAVTPLAFNHDVWPPEARKPEVGDTVIFAKYAGVLVTGVDGREYRACKDRDLIAIYTEQPNV